MAIERIVPGTLEWDAFYANHINRYRFAVDTIENKGVIKILDAACGVGYGSEYMAKCMSGVRIVAVDRSKEALSIAKKHFIDNQVKFLEDDCHNLGAANAFAPYDAVVSFETLEHLPHPEKFLASCYRVLKEGGNLIVSTPNRLSSSPEQLKWEYHEKEYKPDELAEMLQQAGFSSVEMYGQRLTVFGKFRQQIHAELNTLHSNPFVRMGKMIQKVLKGHKFPAILPEQPEDIEVVKYNNISDFYKEGVNGPFVLIAVVKK